MAISNGNCLHIMLFGTFNENKYFLGDYKDSFDLIGFNANIIAHASAGMAAFISSLQNKSYFIDPQTYGFQQPLKTIMRKKNDSWEIKSSIKKLAERYGSLIKQKAGKSRLRPTQLSSDVINEVCINVLDFEFDIIQSSLKDDKKEFLDYDYTSLRPQFLISPYFYIEPDDFDNEIDANIKFCNKSTSINKYGIPLFAEMIIHKDIISDDKFVDALIEKYKECSVDGFLLWIDEFSEINSRKPFLEKYISFLGKLNTFGKPIINLHGSFLSIILSGEISLLAGVGHGIEYGEYRPVVPVGGGVPLSKFYFPNFYERVDYHPDATDILLEKNWAKNKKTYLSKVCSCNMCKSIISNNVQKDFQQYGELKKSEKNQKMYPTSEAMDKSRRHYLNTKIIEYELCRNSTLEDILKEQKINKILSDDIISHSFDHMNRWLLILENFKRKS